MTSTSAHADDPHLTALVALRDPGEGKTRLTPALSPLERAQLARAMARAVIGALTAAGIPQIVILAGGARAARFAHRIGLPVLRDRHPTAGLNSALDDALRIVGRSQTVLLVCADLPGLQARDVTRVVTTDAQVVVAPTRDGGTGGLLLRSGARFALAYGAGSAAAHRQRSLHAGLSVATVITPGFRQDVDEPRHLDEVVTRWPETHTGRLVTGWQRSASGRSAPGGPRRAARACR